MDPLAERDRRVPVLRVRYLRPRLSPSPLRAPPLQRPSGPGAAVGGDPGPPPRDDRFSRAGGRVALAQHPGGIPPAGNGHEGSRGKGPI